MSHTTTRFLTFHFHKDCYDKLRGPRVGGRYNTMKLNALIAKAEREYLEKQFRINAGLEPEVKRPVILPKPEEKLLAEPITSSPKAHVLEFEPPKEVKEDDLQHIIWTMRYSDKLLSSEELAELTGIKRSTITWRLWENTVGNIKSKNNLEVFYHKVGPKGIQLYGLVNERIKDDIKYQDLMQEIEDIGHLSKEAPITALRQLEVWGQKALDHLEGMMAESDLDLEPTPMDDVDLPLTDIKETSYEEPPYTYDDIQELEEEE